MNTTESPPAPIYDLELVVQDTNALAIKDKAVSELVGTLKPIADLIPGYQKLANTIRVTNEAEASAAAQVRESMIADATAAEKALREFDGKLVERLFKTHRAWTSLIARFSALNDAAKKVKQAILSWQQAEEEKARKEAHRLQAAADEKARLERLRLEKEAAKLKTPELREQRMEQAAAVTAPVIHVAAPTKAVAGQKRWKVKSFDMTLMGIAPEVQGYITVETSKLERAKAANSMLSVPGVVFHQVLV